MSSPEVFPFGKYKGQPVEAVAADTGYCEWLTTQKWFKGKYRDLYRALRDGTEPVASAGPPVPVLIGHTEPEHPIPGDRRVVAAMGRPACARLPG